MTKPRYIRLVVLDLPDHGNPTIRVFPGLATGAGIISVTRNPDYIGVDSPLGWPIAFVKAVSAHEGGGPWHWDVDRDALPSA